MIISHKIRLNPNNKQATYLAKAAGTARFAYNWALAEWQTQYAAWKEDNTQSKPSQFSQWTCPVCGASHDRDVNAAINLVNYAVSSTVSVCGGDGSGSRCKPIVKPAPVKQEFNRKLDLG